MMINYRYLVYIICFDFFFFQKTNVCFNESIQNKRKERESIQTKHIKMWRKQWFDM